MMEDYRLGLARSYRAGIQQLTVDRAKVRSVAGVWWLKHYADADPSEEAPTAEQLESALWEWLHDAVDELIEDAFEWTDRGFYGAPGDFAKALRRAQSGKPYHLDAFLEEQANKLEAEAAAAKASRTQEPETAAIEQMLRLPA